MTMLARFISGAACLLVYSMHVSTCCATTFAFPADAASVASPRIARGVDASPAGFQTQPHETAFLPEAVEVEHSAVGESAGEAKKRGERRPPAERLQHAPVSNWRTPSAWRCCAFAYPPPTFQKMYCNRRF